jgi:ABC-type transport system involved in multi-copper enzyme maturation permease subunit
MILLPIVQRELLAGARNRATYWTRCAIALVGVLICMQSMNAGMVSTPATLGRYVFNAVLAAAFIVSCSVCLLSADAISAERREGTLELLFLTGVRPLDVLLGKLGSVGLTSVCALVAFLPALMVPLLAGGVTGGEAFRKGLALLNLLFFALVAGLCASALKRDRFRASRLAVLLVALVVIVPFLVLVVSRQTVSFCFGLLSPLLSEWVAGDTYYSASPRPFWMSLLLLQVAGWALLLGAGLLLRRALSQEGSGQATQIAAEPVEKPQVVGLMSWQPAKDESTPVEWLVYRRFRVGALLWAAALLALAYNGWVPLAQTFGGRRGSLFAWFFAWPFAVTAGLVGGAIVAWVASRFFVAVRRSGDLELLLTTPVGAATIVSDQWSVLKRLFAFPVLVMQAPMLPQLVAAMAAVPGAALGGSPGASLVLFKVLSLANTFLGVAALCWLGLWFGLKARTQAAAIVWAVGLGKGVPALVTLLGLVLREGLMSASGGLGGGLPVVLWLPEMVNLAFYLWLIGFARRRLLADLANAEPLPFNLPESWGELLALGRSLFPTATE